MINNIGDERLFNTPFYGIVLVDTKGIIARVNSKMLSMTGYEDADMVSRCVADFVHKDDVEHLYSSCKHMPGQTRNVSGVVVKFINKDGVSNDCTVNIFNINDDDGTIMGHVLYVDKYYAESFRKTDSGIDGDVNWIAIKDKDQKEEFLCNIFHGIHDAILILDVSGNIISYNMKMLELIGVDMDYMSTVGSFKSISASDLNMSVADRYLKEAFAGTDQSFTWQIQKAGDAEIIDIEVYLTKIDKMGEQVLLATLRDITDKKRMEDDLVNSEDRYRQLVEHSPDGIVIHRKGVIKYVNPAGAVILGGKKAEDILGLPVLDFFAEEKREYIKERLKFLYEDKQSIPLTEGELIRLDGTVINVDYAAMPFDMEGKTAVQVVIRDTTEKKKQDQYIRYLALHDTLTGLPNRELLSNRIAKAAQRRQRDALKNAIFYIDLDSFKPINDTLGHDAGDEALKEIATRLESSIRGSDTAARIGGDEFVILLEGVRDFGEIKVIVNRVQENINEPIVINGHEFHVGASTGISVYPDDSKNHSDLMSMADKAMYDVKATGKNRYKFFSEINS